MLNPLSPVFEFFLALFYNLPLPFIAFFSLYFTLFFLLSILSLLYKIRS